MGAALDKADTSCFPGFGCGLFLHWTRHFCVFIRSGMFHFLSFHLINNQNYIYQSPFTRYLTLAASIISSVGFFSAVVWSIYKRLASATQELDDAIEDAFGADTAINQSKVTLASTDKKSSNHLYDLHLVAIVLRHFKERPPPENSRQSTLDGSLPHFPQNFEQDVAQITQEEPSYGKTELKPKLQSLAVSEELHHHRQLVRRMQCSPDGNLIAIASSDQTVLIHSLNVSFSL
jgi:hypothetical protein